MTFINIEKLQSNICNAVAAKALDVWYKPLLTRKLNLSALRKHTQNQSDL